MAKKILVVDDEPDILKVVVFRLKKLGHEVITAMDGQQGLEMIRSQRPNLVVLDYRMPVMDGIQVCRTVKQDPVLRDTFVIMLSASTGDHLEALAKESLADMQMKKPFDSEQLLATISSHLE
jgi:two-component system, OmpR family, alkaline phosphatase synthesis response regulator PhoP